MSGAWAGLIAWDTPNIAHSGGGTGTSIMGQYLTTKTGTITTVIAYVNGTQTQRIKIWADNGADKNGTVLGTSNTTVCAGDCTYVFSTPVSISAGTKYWVGCEGVAGGACGINDEGSFSGTSQQTGKFLASQVLYTGAYIDMNIYEGASVDANYSYTINKTLGQIQLINTSTETGTSVQDTNWIVNGIYEKHTNSKSDYNHEAVQLTDYNVCLQVGDKNTPANNDQYCLTISTGDWTAPDTNASFSQAQGQSIQQVRFTCGDNNSGCKWTTYWTDTNTTRNIVTNTGTKDINISGAGTKILYFYSTDNSDNNHSTDNNTFTTYGSAHFTFKDENSGAALTGVSVNFNGTTTPVTGSQYDINLASLGATDATYLFTFSKTNYATRYYQADLNQLTDLNKTFALIPDTLDADIPFKVYATDQSTLFTSTYVEVLDKDTNYTIGRLKTDTSGEVTFNLKADDSNYWTVVNNGQYIYTPVQLTILYPKNEDTLAQITENWKVEITQNLYASYSDLNTSKIIYLLPNTSLPYNIKISDMNGNYFSRTYSKIYPGNPLTDTLQPYLVTSLTGLLTTVTTVDVATLLPVPDITIKIYKFMAGLGRTYVEQITTDSKGQALILLVLNNGYEFEIYQNGSLLRTDSITATSSTISIKIPSSVTINQDRNYFNLKTMFTPTRNKLISSDIALVQTITLTNYGIDTTSISSLKIWVTDFNATSGTDKNIYTVTISNPGKTYTSTHVLNTTARTVDGNKYDANGYLTVYVQVTLSNGQVSVYSQQYGLPNARGLTQGLSFDLRPLFGCSTTGNDPCGMMILAALFLSLLGTIGIAIESGFSSMEGMGIIFLVLMGIFVYLAWVPMILYGLMVILMIVLGIAIGGNKI